MNTFTYSRLAVGMVTHRRHAPKKHWFNYTLYYAWLNLDELSSIDHIPFWSTKKPSLVEFRRSDFLRPLDRSLKEAVIQHLEDASLREKPHRVMLLTHLRQWGKSFNPVSFYFCFRDDDSCIAILSEITNTPWGERHVYVHDMAQAIANQRHPTFEFEKAFHISPFMPMDIQYRWQFGLNNERVTIFMQSYRHEQLKFDVNLNLKLIPLTHTEAIKIPFRFAFMPIKVVVGIYWQALKLWCKRIPFYNHPSTEERVLGCTHEETHDGR